MSKKEIKDVVIDADHILYLVTEAQIYKTKLGGKRLGKEKVDLTPYKEHFKSIVEDYVSTAEVEAIAYNWTIGKTKVIISDRTNFRYEIYPEYKEKRPPSPKLRKRLKKWAMKKYIFEPNTEADDVVAHYVRKGAVGFTTDKDLFFGVEGLWFNCHYQSKHWVRTTAWQAEFFFKKQVLAGDSVDGIPSIDGVGLATAEKLLIKYGDSWDDILSIFEDNTKVLGKVVRGQTYDKDYMITMTRLVCMNQWTPKHGIRLWRFP